MALNHASVIDCYINAGEHLKAPLNEDTGGAVAAGVQNSSDSKVGDKRLPGGVTCMKQCPAVM